jgi:hypothetical protein
MISMVSSASMRDPCDAGHSERFFSFAALLTSPAARFTRFARAGLVRGSRAPMRSIRITGEASRWLRAMVDFCRTMKAAPAMDHVFALRACNNSRRKGRRSRYAISDAQRKGA